MGVYIAEGVSNYLSRTSDLNSFVVVRCSHRLWRPLMAFCPTSYLAVDAGSWHRFAGRSRPMSEAGHSTCSSPWMVHGCIGSHTSQDSIGCFDIRGLG